MKSSEYLYGVEITSLPSMSEGLVARIEHSERLLNELLSAPLEHRDWTRIRAVVDAIEHNNKILHGAI